MVSSLNEIYLNPKILLRNTSLAIHIEWSIHEWGVGEREEFIEFAADFMFLCQVLVRI